MLKDGDLGGPAQILQRQGRADDTMLQRVRIRLLSLQEIVRRSAQADPASFLSGARTDIYEPVGRIHGLGIMFDDHDRVALVAQLLQRIDQLPVVSLMQADARLIEDVEHIDQLGAYLCGQTDALAFTSGKGCGSPVQRKIVQADVQHETDPFPELLENVASDPVLPAGHLLRQRIQPLLQGADLHRRDFRDRLREGAVPDPEQLVRTENYQRHGFVRNRGYRIIKGEIVFARYRAYNIEFSGFPYLSERDDTSVGDRDVAVRDYRVDIDIDNHSEAFAVRAVALRRVERERMRRRLLQRKPAVRIHEMS